MVDVDQISKWLKEGTISQTQANKMLADSTQKESKEKSNSFFGVIAIIGAVLIFLGFAWLIAKNWHQIPDVIKVIILLGATIASFVSGVLLRERGHEGTGRSLITLGALLFILSLFLISQIYHLASSMQHYTWILFIAWIFIMLTAYLLDSQENLVLSMLLFFPWVVFQYLSSVSLAHASSGGGAILGFILIFLSSGVLLFGLNVLHNSSNHKFTNIYRFWTAFYFLTIFYLLSFQSFLPILGEYSFDGGFFSVFLVMFLLICFFGFLIGTVFAMNKNSTSLKEILVFIGILAVLFLLIFSTKAGAGLMGTCYPQSCYDFSTPSDCSSSPKQLDCRWINNYCMESSNIQCSDFKTSKECSTVLDTKTCGWVENSLSAGGMSCMQVFCGSYSNKMDCSSKSNCNWIGESDEIYLPGTFTATGSRCFEKELDSSAEQNIQISDKSSRYEECSVFDNQKDSCTTNSLCKWQSSYGLGHSSSLPAILWILWIVNNIILIGFIILILWYGQTIGSEEIVNLALLMFILDVLSRYIGFWMDFKGYLAFSILAIMGGLMLIFGSWLIPKWRRSLLEKTKQAGVSGI